MIIKVLKNIYIFILFIELKDKTIVLAKCGKYIFGGYSSKSWTTANKTIKSSKNFLF